MIFNKPALSIDDQIDRLKRRGMIIDDVLLARHWLTHVSYYRLRAYWLPFEGPAPSEGEHCFKPECRFEDVISAYVFDRQLRLLVMDALERIEVSLRGSWAHHLAMTHGSHGYLEPKLYRRDDWYDRAMQGLDKEVSRSTDTFIGHYRDKYTSPAYPPIWMSAEVISLGLLSKWVDNLAARADRNAISQIYGLDEKVLMSAMHHLTYVRNICAHHSRLWNKQFTVTMRIPRNPWSLHKSMNESADRVIYNTLVMVAHLLEVAAPKTRWRADLIGLLEARSDEELRSMGFPVGWLRLPIWATTPRENDDADVVVSNS